MHGYFGSTGHPTQAATAPEAHRSDSAGFARQRRWHGAHAWRPRRRGGFRSAGISTQKVSTRQQRWLIAHCPAAASARRTAATYAPAVWKHGRNPEFACGPCRYANLIPVSRAAHLGAQSQSRVRTQPIWRSSPNSGFARGPFGGAGAIPGSCFVRLENEGSAFVRLGPIFAFRWTEDEPRICRWQFAEP